MFVIFHVDAFFWWRSVLILYCVSKSRRNIKFGLNSNWFEIHKRFGKGNGLFYFP
jgi:hypothetical protein